MNIGSCTYTSWRYWGQPTHHHLPLALRLPLSRLIVEIWSYSFMTKLRIMPMTTRGRCGLSRITIQSGQKARDKV